MSRPIRALVDLAAVERNLMLARRSARLSKVMAVIKADAYGHGLLRAAEALRRADAFALLDIADAARLREAGYAHRILLLEGLFETAEMPMAEHLSLDLMVHTGEQVRMLSALSGSRRLNICLKLNTGMNRLGFRAEDFSAAYQALVRNPAVKEITLATHFARADEPGGVDDALRRFEEITSGLALPRSLANSAALLKHPKSHAEWVRPGIMLYGATPVAEESAASLGLVPAMTLESKVISVQELRSGDRVGYGGLFRAEGPMRVGTVACGYADGYPRHAPSGTPVAVDGVRTRTVGRVSMDMLAVDLTPVPGGGVGSRVELWGGQVPVDEVAKSCGTVGYELLCAVAARVPVSEV